MDAKEVVADMRESITDLRGRGSHFITVDQLARYCDAVEKDLTESIEQLKLTHTRETELMRLDHLNQLEQYKAARTSDIEGFKSVIEAGKEALKAVVLINGGAAVVVIGFLGAVVSRGVHEGIGNSMTEPLAAFGIGVVLGAIGFGARYLSQALFFSPRPLSKKYGGEGFRVLSVLVAVAAYLAFGWGLWHSYQAFEHYFRAGADAIAGP